MAQKSSGCLSVMNGSNIRLRMTLKINVGCLSLASEMNGANIRLRMTLKINVGCLSLASEMNGGNIRLRMTLKINVGCLSLASEMNGANIRLRMTLKINVGCLSLASEMNGGNIRLRMTQFPSDHMPVSVYKPHPWLLIFFRRQKGAVYTPLLTVTPLNPKGKKLCYHEHGTIKQALHHV